MAVTPLAADDHQLAVTGEETISTTLTFDGDGYPAELPNPVYPGGTPHAGTAHRDAVIVYDGGILNLEEGADLSVRSDTDTAFLRVGYGVDGTGTLNIGTGAVLTVGQDTRYANFHVGDGVGASGSVNQTGGDVLVIGSLNLGVNGGSGTYTINDGTLTFDRTSDGGTSLINLGFNQSEEEGVTSTGHLVINGGLVELLSPTRDGVNGSTQLILGNRQSGNPAGDGIIDQTGGILRIGEGGHLYLSSHGDGVYNLNGGVLEVGGQGLQGNYQGNGSYEFNLGGGFIRVIGSDLVTDVDANVTARSGIDTNGFDARWSGNLQGAAEFAKLGDGELILDGQIRNLGMFTTIGGNTRQEAGDTTLVEFMVGYGAGLNSSYELAGGTITSTKTFQVGTFGGTGVFTQNEGTTVTVESGGSLDIGNQGGTGTYNLDGGTLTLKKALHNLGRVGSTTYSAGHGELNINDGLLELIDGGKLINGGRIEGPTQGSGEINQNGGIVRISDGTLYIAGHGDGTYNLNGGVLEVGGTGLQARYNNNTATSTFNLNGGLIRVIGSNLVTAVDANIGDGTFTAIDTNDFDATWSGNINGALGTYGKIGQGALIWSGTSRSLRGLAVFEGGIRQTAGNTTASYEFMVGTGAGAEATYELTGGTIEIGTGASFRVGDFGGTGLFTQSGGTVTLAAGSSFNIGNQGGTGTYHMTGGTLNLGEVGKSGGNHSLSRATSSATGPSEGTFLLDDGTVNLNGGYFVLSSRDASVNDGGTGTFTQNGGTFTVDNGAQLAFTGNKAGGHGIYNLNGGVLAIGARSLTTEYNQFLNQPSKGTYEFNLGGGTLRVTGANLTTAVNATLVADTTSTLDTNGFDAFWNGAFDGAGAFRKLGEGNLTLSGGGSIGDDQSTSYVDEGGFTIAKEALDLYGQLIVRNGGTLAVTSTLDVHTGSASRTDGTFNGLFVGYGGIGTLDLNGTINLHVEDQSGNVNIGRTDGSVAGIGSAIMRGGSIVMDESARTGGNYISFNVGRGANSVGTFDQRGGLVDIKGGAFQIGVEGAQGSYTLSNDAAVSLSNGTVYIGDGENGNGRVEVLDSATFTHTYPTSGQFYLGSEKGTGAFVQNGADSLVKIVVANPVSIGFGGTGTYDLLAGALEIGGSSGTKLGRGATGPKNGPSVGYFNQSGGSLTAIGSFVVGAEGTGAFSMSGGTATFRNDLVIAQAAGSQGTVNLQGGTVEIGGVNAIRTGQGDASVNLGNGTIRVVGSALSTAVNATLESGKRFTIDTNDLGATWTGALDGDGDLNKEGDGTLTLAGANTYTGETVVTAGTLSVTSTTGTGTVTIGKEATLSGSGIVAGQAVIEGKLAPGNSPGTLTFSQGLTLTTTAQTVLEITGTGAGEFDVLQVDAGVFSLDGGLTLDITAAIGNDTLATFSLFQLDDDVSLLNNFASVTVTGLYGAGAMTFEDNLWALTLDGGTNVTFNNQTGVLSVETIPEPSTWLLLTGGALALQCLRRKKE